MTRGRKGILLAWLLRSNRMLGDDVSLRSARAFAAVFRDRNQPPLAPSQVTRWETGQTGVPDAVVERYEVLLGLPRHSLSIVYEAAATFFYGPTSPIARSEGMDDCIHELLERSRSGSNLAGAEWRHLTRLITSCPGLVLHPPELWRSVAEALLRELVIAEHDEWFARQEAMSRLLAHPVGGRHAVSACIDLAEDVGNPVFIEPISLLDATNHPVANDYVKEMLGRPRNRQAFEGALIAAASKLSRGHYSVPQAVELRDVAGTHLAAYRSHPTLGPLLGELSSMTSRGRPQRFPQECERLVLDVAAATISRLQAPMAQSDPVLQDLLADALFSDNPDRRLYSAAVISATPYRLALAGALADRLSSRATASDLLIERGLRLLTKLRVDNHYAMIRQVLDDPAATARVRHAAVLAASHGAGTLDESAWRTLAHRQLHLFATRPSPLDVDILRGLVYDVGAAGHLRLIAELAEHPAIPSSVRRHARWWHTQVTCQSY